MKKLTENELRTFDLFPDLTEADKEEGRLTVYFADTIRNRRKELNLNQTQLADRIGVAQPMISQWESGDTNFSISTLAKVMDALGLRMNISCVPVEAPARDIPDNIIPHSFGGAERKRM